MALKDNLKRLRKLRNISQRELAEETNLTPAYIALIETGNRTNPSLDVLNKLTKALGVTVSELLDDRTA